jgi:hypothetical protein
VHPTPVCNYPALQHNIINVLKRVLAVLIHYLQSVQPLIILLKEAVLFMLRHWILLKPINRSVQQYKLFSVLVSAGVPVTVVYLLVDFYNQLLVAV